MAISINTLHPLLSARASGIDLSRPIVAADFEAIKAAVDRYGVLLLQGPRLTPEEQIAFAGLFGTLESQNGVLSTGIAPRITRKLVDIRTSTKTMQFSVKPTGAGCSLWEISSGTPIRRSSKRPHPTRCCTPMPCRRRVAKLSSSTCVWRGRRCRRSFRPGSRIYRRNIRFSARARNWVSPTSPKPNAPPRRPCTDPWCGCIPGRADRRCISRRTPRT